MSVSDSENTAPSDDEIHFVESNFQVHKFFGEVGERTVIYQVIKMEKSLLICINEKGNLELNNLFMSLLSEYDSLPIGTRLLGNFTEEEVSKGMASRLCKELKKTVYVSCNIERNRGVLSLVEKRLHEEIRSNREAF